MNFDIYLTGQYSENYGAHDWNGEGACPQYWKLKGSTEKLFMSNVPLAGLEDARRAAAEAIASGLHNEKSEYYSATYCDIELMPADASNAVHWSIRYNLSESDMIRYENATAEDINLVKRWREYFGDEVVAG